VELNRRADEFEGGDVSVELTDVYALGETRFYRVIEK
jgi:hypothetical protein|tara:strand:+ start:420 stop:530 length:111 start_codon:yes stop_codon:yes gene_type:complete